MTMHSSLTAPLHSGRHSDRTVSTTEASLHVTPKAWKQNVLLRLSHRCLKQQHCAGREPFMASLRTTHHALPTQSFTGSCDASSNRAASHGTLDRSAQAFKSTIHHPERFEPLPTFGKRKNVAAAIVWNTHLPQRRTVKEMPSKSSWR